MSETLEPLSPASRAALEAERGRPLPPGMEQQVWERLEATLGLPPLAPRPPRTEPSSTGSGAPASHAAAPSGPLAHVAGAWKAKVLVGAGIFLLGAGTGAGVTRALTPRGVPAPVAAPAAPAQPPAAIAEAGPAPAAEGPSLAAEPVAPPPAPPPPARAPAQVAPRVDRPDVAVAARHPAPPAAAGTHDAVVPAPHAAPPAATAPHDGAVPTPHAAPPAAAATPDVTPPPAAPAKAAPSAGSLRAERELLDIARAALDRRAYADAWASIEKHERQFPDGQLQEERESLAIQCLANRGDHDAARARAARFEARFPQSLLLPVVRAVLESAP